MSTSAVFRASGKRPVSFKRKLGIAFRLSLVILPLVLMLGGVFWVFSFLLGFTQQGITLLPLKRPSETVMDPAHLLPDTQRSFLDHQVVALNQAMQADWVLVIVPQLDPRQTQEVAEKLFVRWQLGKRSFNQRGALLLVSAHPQKASLVLGKDLQHAFGKGLQQAAGEHVGDFLQDHVLRLYLENKSLSEGLVASLNFMNHQFNPNFQTANILMSERPGGAHTSSMVLPPAE